MFTVCCQRICRSLSVRAPAAFAAPGSIAFGDGAAKRLRPLRVTIPWRKSTSAQNLSADERKLNHAKIGACKSLRQNPTPNPDLTRQIIGVHDRKRAGSRNHAETCLTRNHHPTTVEHDRTQTPATVRHRNVERSVFRRTRPARQMCIRALNRKAARRFRRTALSISKDCIDPKHAHAITNGQSMCTRFATRPMRSAPKMICGNVWNHVLEQ